METFYHVKLNITAYSELKQVHVKFMNVAEFKVSEAYTPCVLYTSDNKHEKHMMINI